MREEVSPADSLALKVATTANVIATSLGMTSLGLLAMLITHHDLEERGYSAPALITADIISFSTAILGKIAIVLFFNQAVFLKGFKQLCEKGLSDFLKVRKKPLLEHIGWTLNYVLSLNASLFWAGLVQVSFKQSADILNDLHSNSAHQAGDQIRQWYVFMTFVACSFYANWLSWPGIHQSGYQQIKGLLQWSLEAKAYRRRKAAVTSRMNNAHQVLMSELKNCLKGFRKSEVIRSPRLDALVESLLESDREITLAPLPSFNDKLTYILGRVEEGSLQTLRHAYLDHSTALSSNNVSTVEWLVRHGTATVFTGMAIWGFHNILGLSDTIWSQWKLPAVSTYGARYAAYFSFNEIICLTVYPMIYNLVGMVKRGMPSHLFSKYTLGFIFSMVAFVGIFGGLANSEQSYLDGESAVNIIVADFASFVVDAFAIYSVLRTFVEQRILKSTKGDEVTALAQQCLKLQALGSAACEMDSISEKEFISLEHGTSNDTDINSANPHRVEPISVGSERQVLLGGGNRMFCCFEGVLRCCFNVEKEGAVVSSILGP